MIIKYYKKYEKNIKKILKQWEKQFGKWSRDKGGNWN